MNLRPLRRPGRRPHASIQRPGARHLVLPILLRGLDREAQEEEKRGFARKKDAEAYEEEFLKKGSRTCSMTFGSLVELYMDDMRPRLRATTIKSKEYLINLKILPYFQDLQVNDITPAHVRKWQSELLSKNYSPTYVKTIYNQLSAIFNYAVRYYGLRENPARVAGSIGKKKAQEMHFWTLE